MKRTERLLKRLDDIGQSLANTGKGLALLGLGSVGMELYRLDDYSDLDFFAIVRPGHKQEFVKDLSWMSVVHPIAYWFQNTADGHKVLYEDGIFCEMAVFEPDEMAQIPYASERVVWQASGFDATKLGKKPERPRDDHPLEWTLGELLTNLYVGLARFHRGEKLSAMRFIQGYAVDRAIELAARVQTEQPGYRDPFTPERRVERRFPELAAALPDMLQGYQRSPESARAILAFVERYYPVNGAIKQVILDLCERGEGAAE